MKPYKPKAMPASQVVAVLLSLGAFGLAAAAARELWTKRTGTALESWLRPVFDTISRAHFESWMFPAGVISAVVGLVLVIIALKPRPSTHEALAAAPNFWIRNVDVARLCTATAERVPSVATASTYAAPRHVTVTITGSDRHADLAERVAEAVQPILDQLADERTLTVKLHSLSEAEQ
ncbi:DUF6286 domain-containing protein [Corynebacterium sp. H130]|uniref:DUF6286 domain-containing protein n=1 Tax=Corynebacterium sp. H130 TaxID=3133444 RepID=UPI00309A392A